MFLFSTPLLLPHKCTIDQVVHVIQVKLIDSSLHCSQTLLIPKMKMAPKMKQTRAQACRLASMLTWSLLAFVSVTNVFPGENSAPMFVTARLRKAKLVQLGHSTVAQSSGSRRRFLDQASQSPTGPVAAAVDPTVSPTPAVVTTAPPPNPTLAPSKHPTVLPTGKPTSKVREVLVVRRIRSPSLS